MSDALTALVIAAAILGGAMFLAYVAVLWRDARCARKRDAQLTPDQFAPEAEIDRRVI